jgi:hypothetical protein
MGLRHRPHSELNQKRRRGRGGSETENLETKVPPHSAAQRAQPHSKPKCVSRCALRSAVGRLVSTYERHSSSPLRMGRSARTTRQPGWSRGGGGVGDYGGACAPEAATGRPGALWVASPPGSVEQPKAARQVRPGDAPLPSSGPVRWGVCGGGRLALLGRRLRRGSSLRWDRSDG